MAARPAPPAPRAMPARPGTPGRAATPAPPAAPAPRAPPGDGTAGTDRERRAPRAAERPARRGPRARREAPLVAAGAAATRGGGGRGGGSSSATPARPARPDAADPAAATAGSGGRGGTTGGGGSGGASGGLTVTSTAFTERDDDSGGADLHRQQPHVAAAHVDGRPDRDDELRRRARRHEQRLRPLGDLGHPGGDDDAARQPSQDADADDAGHGPADQPIHGRRLLRPLPQRPDAHLRVRGLRPRRRDAAGRFDHGHAGGGPDHHDGARPRAAERCRARRTPACEPSGRAARR